MALTIARGNPISFYDLNIAAGLSGTTANTSLAARGTTFSISYATNGTNSLQMCEFYTDGCPGVIPPTPTGFSVGNAVGLNFYLSWTASAGATSYKIYRGGVYLTTTSGVSITVSGLAYSTSYCWSVSAINVNGESSQTSQICKTTQSGPTLYFVEYLYGANATVACDYGSEANMFYVDAPFILDVTKIYTDVAGTIYAPTAYYSSAGDGVWIRWSNTGIILSSGICNNPI